MSHDRNADRARKHSDRSSRSLIDDFTDTIETSWRSSTDVQLENYSRISEAAEAQPPYIQQRDGPLQRIRVPAPSSVWRRGWKSTKLSSLCIDSSSLDWFQAPAQTHTLASGSQSSPQACTYSKKKSSPQNRIHNPQFLSFAIVDLFASPKPRISDFDLTD